LLDRVSAPKVLTRITAITTVRPVMALATRGFPLWSIAKRRVHVLVAPCRRYASKTLPLVWLNIHVNMMDMQTVESKNPMKFAPVCDEPVSVKKSGRWNNVQNTPRMMLDVKALYFACNLGRANPRQASSSPLTRVNTINIIVIETAASTGLEKFGKSSERNVTDTSPDKFANPIAPAQTIAYPKIATTYHRSPTFAINNFPNRARIPSLLFVIPVMITAASVGM